MRAPTLSDLKVMDQVAFDGASKRDLIEKTSERGGSVSENFVEHHVDCQTQGTVRKESNNFCEALIHKLKAEQQGERESAIEQNRIHFSFAEVGKHHSDKLEQ